MAVPYDLLGTFWKKIRNQFCNASIELVNNALE